MTWTKFKNELVKNHGWIRLDYTLQPNPIGKYFQSPSGRITIRSSDFYYQNNKQLCFISKLPNPAYFSNIIFDLMTKCVYYELYGHKVLALDIS